MKNNTSVSPEKIKNLRKQYQKHVLIQFEKQRDISLKLIPFSHGLGSYFWDMTGKRWIDFSSQLFNLQLGHQHPKVVKAIQDQAARYCYVRPTNNLYDIRGELAEKLCAITPGDLNKVYFTGAGTDAVEFAMKLAIQVTGREKICSFYRSYHGSSYGTKSVGGDLKNLEGGTGIPNVYKVHNPYPYRCPFGYAPHGNLEVYLDHVIQTIEYEGPNHTAAVLMETIPGSNGMIIIPPDGFLQRLKKYCSEKGIFFIADEVMTGFGRTGKMFAIEHWGVVPDIMCVAKGITNGAVPMGAIFVNDKISNYFEDHPLYIGLTYSAHPLACAASLATLAAFEEEKILEQCNSSGQLMLRRLEELKDRHPSVGDVRSLGLLGVIEVVVNRHTREPLTNEKVLTKMKEFLDHQGINVFFRWHYILLVPPLNISRETLEEGMSIFDNVLKISDQVYQGHDSSSKL